MGKRNRKKQKQNVMSKENFMDIIDVQKQATNLFKDGQIIAKSDNKTALFDLLSGSLGNNDISTRKMLESYSSNVIDYSCVYAIANTIASLPVKLYKLDDVNNEIEVTNNEQANILLNNPSNMWSWYDFLEMTVTLLELSGFCVVENVFSKQTKELIPLRSDLVEVLTNKEGVAGYKYTTNNGHSEILTTDEAFQIKYANPLDLNRGFSAYNPMRKQLSIDTHTLQFTENFFKNGGHIDGFMNMPIALTKEKKEALYAQYSEMYTGSSKAFKMMLLDKGMTYTPNQVKPEEADLSAIRDMQRADIITARGCYPIVLGFLDGASYANANIQYQLFYSNTIKPKAQKIQDAFNQNVFFNYGLKMVFDYSGVKALQEDQKILADTLKIFKESGVLTINEIRAKGNYKPLNDGDVLPVTQPVQQPIAQKSVKPNVKTVIKSIENKLDTNTNLINIIKKRKQLLG